MLAGQRVGGRYQIKHQIGGGGMSVVYLAHDVILNRDVAIKILRYDFTNEEELHKRFQREALSATSLAHPNIVSVYDVGEDGEMHYIVMEYIDGKTLKKYIQEYAPLSPARAVHIMKQLTSAIAHAHENGIVHRDIKPQNILVDENGDVKVTDFGIATSLNATALTQTNSVLGTVHYLSPEQARGGVATTKSDLYSLGIVLYELLTGELPFSGESAVSIALKHLQSETPSVRTFDATIPQSLENVVLKATAKDALHRYRSAEEMEEDLMTVLSPARMAEPKFVLPYDDDATKAMPVIKDKMPVDEMAKTRAMPSQPVERPEPVRVAPPKEPVVTPVPEKPKKKKKWPLFAGIVLLIVVLGIVAMMAMTPNKIEIPDVAGLTVDEATEELEALGFVIGEIKEVHSDTVEKDLVTETSPRAGLERNKGDEITLMVSLGNETTEMPNYVGQSREQAIRLINQAEFVDYEIEEKFSNEDEGTVIEQSPRAGDDIIMEETSVRLVVSKGKEIVKVQLQNLKGWNESALKEYAKSAKLKINITSTEASETVPAGQVIRHSPEAGTSVNEGSTVNVVLSSGPAAKQEKTYVKTITIPYEPTEEGMAQTVRVYIQDKDHSMADLFDEIEITADTVYRVTLKIAEGERGAYRIDRDLSVVAEETINFADLE